MNSSARIEEMTTLAREGRECVGELFASLSTDDLIFVAMDIARTVNSDGDSDELRERLTMLVEANPRLIGAVLAQAAVDEITRRVAAKSENE